MVQYRCWRTDCTSWTKILFTLFSHVPWLPCTSTRALLESFWWNTVCLYGVSSSHPITLISLFMLPKSPGISCLVTDSCVLRVPSTILWQNSKCERMLAVKSSVHLGKEFGAVGAEEQPEAVDAQVSLPRDLWCRVYFKTRVSSLPADAACWAWGPELLVKPATVWLKAPVRGIHMATTSAAPGAVSKCPLSSAVEFEMGACLSLGPAGNIWRLEQCWLWHLSQPK